MTIENGFEIAVALAVILLCFLAQMHLYNRIYLKSDGIREEGGPDRKEKIRFWCYFILVDVMNIVIIYLGHRIFMPDILCTARENIDIALPIITTILISFFGLTAAAYTFQVNDIHEQQRRTPNDKLFLEVYLKRTRFKFSVALWSTVLVCFLSVGVYVLEEFLERSELTDYYKLECGFILCLLATEIIFWMLYLNWVLFFHERYIDKYTDMILKRIDTAKEERNNSARLSELLKRVNSLELVFQRLLKNNIHVQDVFPLENRDLLVMAGAGASENIDEASRSEAGALVKQYYELINWRNAVIHLKNSRSRSDTEISIQDWQEENLGKLEKHIREKRMASERFTGMDLSSMDFLRESNLKNADFSDCDLRSVNLEGSDCTGVNFTNALMSRICLNTQLTGRIIKIDEKTKLDHVNFHDCNLEGAGITYQGDGYFSMKEDTFSNVILTGTSLQGVDLEYSSFNMAQLYYNSWISCRAHLTTFGGAKLSNSKLIGTDFKRADFSEAVLVDAEITDCCFEEARLYKTDFFNANISGGNWTKVMASGASFKSANILPDARESAKNPEVSFRQSVLQNVDFTGSWLSGVDMSDCQINECIFTGAGGDKNCFSNADMKDCQFNRTRWKRSIFDYVRFDQSVFKNAQFSESRFVGTSFDQCLFLNTERNASPKLEIRADWEKEMLAETREPSPSPVGKPHASCFFRQAYLEDVSFAQSYGLEAEMFLRATIVRTDFQGTGITKCQLEKYALHIEDCNF